MKKMAKPDGNSPIGSRPLFGLVSFSRESVKDAATLTRIDLGNHPSPATGQKTPAYRRPHQKRENLVVRRDFDDFVAGLLRECGEIALRTQIGGKHLENLPLSMSASAFLARKMAATVSPRASTSL